MIGGIVPVGDDWMISGTPMAFPDQADQVLAGVPEIVMKFPERVFRNPEKLAQGRDLQAEQRESFIDLHGGDLVVVPGDQVQKTLMAFYRHNTSGGSKAGPWTEPDLPPLPGEWTSADSVALIYDAEDGLGFYVDYAAARRAFADPDLVRRRPYRDIISAYLREEQISPVPIRRLVAEAGPEAGRLFRTLLKKPRFSWERDGEALLRRYKADWYDNPPLPRVTPRRPPSPGGSRTRSRSEGTPREPPRTRNPRRHERSGFGSVRRTRSKRSTPRSWACESAG